MAAVGVGRVALAEAAVYLATAPKSNSLYIAYSGVQQEVKTGRNEPVPLHLRNAVTKLMKDIGYGKDYRYAHDAAEGTTDMECLPEKLRGRRYYVPKEIGFEKTVAERLRYWQRAKGSGQIAKAQGPQP